MASDDQRGYDCQFVDPVPDCLICLICTSVARDPQQMVCCGKIYCKACLSDLKSSCEDARCPQCRKEINSFPDTRGDRDVKSLKVHCDNKTDGCEWTGELQSLEEHLTGCAFTFLPCPNGCKDRSGQIVKLLCKDLRKHKSKCPRRQYKCRHCKVAGEYLERTTTHLEKCPSIRVACPNTTCREKIPRFFLAIHHRDCPFEEVPCKYARIGCNSRFPRREREEHESNAEHHLQMAVDTVSELKSKLNEQQNLVFMLRNFEQHKASDKSASCISFYTGPGGYRMRVKVYANGLRPYKGTYVSVYAYLLRGVNDDHLSWPFTGKVIIELLNQLEDANHHVGHIDFPAEGESSKRVYDLKSSSGYVCRGYISHSALSYDATKNCQYLKDDCLCFRVSAEAPSPVPWLKVTGNLLSYHL